MKTFLWLKRFRFLYLFLYPSDIRIPNGNKVNYYLYDFTQEGMCFSLYYVLYTHIYTSTYYTIYMSVLCSKLEFFRHHWFYIFINIFSTKNNVLVYRYNKIFPRTHINSLFLRDSLYHFFFHTYTIYMFVC